MPNGGLVSTASTRQRRRRKVTLTSSRQFHKFLCRAFADFQQRPSPDVRRAILLPDDGTNPRFTWLPVQEKKYIHAAAKARFLNDDGTVNLNTDWGVPDFTSNATSYLPGKVNALGHFDIPTKATMLVCGSFCSGNLLDHSVLAMARQNTAGCQPNKCLLRLIKKGPPNTELARGPLLLFGMEKVKLPKTTVDLDTTSFTLALNSMVDPVEPGKTPWPAQKVAGVKVNTDTTPPSLEDVQIPKRHPIFTKSTRSAVGDLMQTGLITWAYATKTTASTTKAGDTMNTPANPSDTTPLNPKLLHLSLDPSSPDFGTIPPSIQADNCSILVARLPNKGNVGIEVEHLSRFLRLLERKVAPMLQGPGTPEARLRGVDDMAKMMWEKTSEWFKGMGLVDKDMKFPGP